MTFENYRGHSYLKDLSFSALKIKAFNFQLSTAFYFSSLKNSDFSLKIPSSGLDSRLL